MLIIPALILLDIRWIIGNFYSLSIGTIDFTDPAIAFQAFLTGGSLSIKLLGGIIIPIILALIFGRVFCGWICPFNSVSELLSVLFSSKFGMKRNYSNPSPILAYLFIIILSLLVLITGYNLFNYLALPGLLSFNVSLIVLGNGFALTFFLILILAIVESVFGRRIWCKYMCPSGLVLNILRISRTLKITYDVSECKCSANSPCSKSCPLNLNPKDKGLYPYCYNCGKCLYACELTKNKALQYSFKKK